VNEALPSGQDGFEITREDVMQTQHAIFNAVNYSFETEDFEQWQLSSLVVIDDAEADENESAYDEESLAGNVIEFLKEAAEK
jgi:hypothetical protein